MFARVSSIDSHGPGVQLSMEPHSLQSHLRHHHLDLMMVKQEGAGGADMVLQPPSAFELLSESRLYARRKRRHEEALRNREDEANTAQLFPDSEKQTQGSSWSDGIRKLTTDSQEYVKLVTPSGTLTKDVAKDLLLRLNLPVKTEMGVMLQMMYRHFFYGSETSPPKIDSKEHKKMFDLLRSKSSTYAGIKASDRQLISYVYTNFKHLMNDPSTYDTAAVQERNRVQGDPEIHPSKYIMPIPKTMSGRKDRRYTAGDYNSARDLLNRRRYMSVAGGPFGGYQMDLLDMGVKGKPFNKQFWYLLTLVNTNSRYVYACPIKKGDDLPLGYTKAQLIELRRLSDEPRERPQWIQNQIIPALSRIMDQIDVDISEGRALGKNLSHRKITNLMFDAGTEFQLALRTWLVEKGISSQVCEPQTHEEMTRLNSFHRYFRSRYQMQWRKFFANRREYGGPVQWISPKADKAGFAGPSRTVLQSPDAAVVVSVKALDAISNLAEKEEAKEQEADIKVGEGVRKEDTAMVEEDTAMVEGEKSTSESAESDDDFQFQEEKDSEPQEQKEAVTTGRWRVTYWEDWVSSHNRAVKKLAFRGAEMKTNAQGVVRFVNVAKSPSEITDVMVYNLIRVDAIRREAVKLRVDEWIKVHGVLTEEDLAEKDQGYATRVRLDLNRTKFGQELKRKGTTFLSIWSKRHYALKKRTGTNTFEVQHEHGIDFPDIWPMYRMRVVVDPSNVSQPFETEAQVNPGKDEKWTAYGTTVSNRADDDALRLQELQEKALEAISDQKDKEDNLQDLNGGVDYDKNARTEDQKAPEDPEKEQMDSEKEQMEDPEKEQKPPKKPTKKPKVVPPKVERETRVPNPSRGRVMAEGEESTYRPRRRR